MEFTLADDDEKYLSVLKEKIGVQYPSGRFELVDAAMDNLPFGDGSFDLVILRGAFFFLMDQPHILSEVYRVLAPGGLAFIGGGYGKGIPQSLIDGIADESRILNDRLGRRRVEISRLLELLKENGIEKDSQIIEEGGVWIQVRRRVKLAPVKKVSGLAGAFGLRPSGVISLVGGGGKTTLMFKLAGELSKSGKTVITTTTTRIMEPANDESPCVIVEEDQERLISRLREEIARCRHVSAARLRPGDGKLKGLLPETIDKIAGLGLSDYIINEADGAARKPLKAPNSTEPVIPSSSTLVIAVVGIDALGEPLSDEVAFRTELITRLTGLPEGGVISPEVIATLITARQGVTQHSPDKARIIPFINKVELPADSVELQQMAYAVLSREHPAITRVVAGSLKDPKSGYQIIEAASIK
jgi:probable selenium-dependent hydroxylase accessory protein YqeC